MGSSWTLLVEIILPKKRTRPQTGRKETSSMASSINWRMAATGKLSLRAAAHSRFTGTISSGELGQSAIDELTAWTSARTKAKWTALIIIDSQAVQNTCNASVESKGFCFYKATNGIKRHLAVDTLGFPFFTHCTSANLSDAGLVEMLTHNIDYFKTCNI